MDIHAEFEGYTPAFAVYKHQTNDLIVKIWVRRVRELYTSQYEPIPPPESLDLHIELGTQSK